MTVKEVIDRGETTFSVEVFPPKTEMDVKEFGNVCLRLDAGSNPDWLSVTCGASGSTVKGPNYDILAQAQKTMAKRPIVAHLTCVCQNLNTVTEHLNRLRKLDINDVLALRGDAPVWANETNPWGVFKHASDLIKDIKEHSLKDFCVGAAAYPEGHPETPLFDQNLDHLKIKQDAGSDYLVTQMFFDNEQFFRWMNCVKKAGVSIPVVAGVMPIFNAERITKMCKLSNARVPGKLHNIIDHFGNSPKAMFTAGIMYTCEQILDLIASGVKNIHLYTMNKPEIAYNVVKNLGGIL